MRETKCPRTAGTAGGWPTRLERDDMDHDTCREDGCEKASKASRGWCWGHYERWRKTGDPQGPVVWHAGETNRDRLLKRIDRAASCWLWTGYIAPNGYGKSSEGWAHRLVYEEWVGPIPDGFDLDHLCRVRRCVNPQHLEPVTRKVNLRRSPLVGRNSHPSPTCRRGHVRTPENTYVRPNGRRECRTCMGISQSRRTTSA